MYLRETKRRKTNGSQVSYLQLANNYRDPETGVVKAQIVHNFGRADQLNREELQRLCRSIGRVCGLEISEAATSRQTVEAGDGDPLPEGLRQRFSRELGVVWVAEALWERLGIGPALRDIEREKKLAVPYERALFAMTANRLSEPLSKLGVWDRWLEKVHLPSCQDLKLDQMYEAMDLLHAHAPRVEEAVFDRTADLFNLEVDVIFYDLTTIGFSIDESDSMESGDIRCLGYNSEGVWAPQVVVALAVTRDGLPVRSWVMPGNTSGMATIQQVRKDLRGWKLGRALFVADSGMNSEDNRRELARACGRYLMAARAGSVAEVQQEVLSRQGRYKDLADNLKVKEVTVGSGELRRRYFVCHNPHEAARQAEHREKVLQEIQTELALHANHSASASWAIALMASKRYGRYLTVGQRNRVVIDREALQKAERMEGKWVLMTNDDTLSADDAATGYKNLLVIERCFRTLKRCELKVSPVYHWLPRRIEAHVKICVLALLIERTAELLANTTWSTLRTTLQKMQATEYETDSHRFFRRNEISQEARSVLETLGIQAPKRLLGIV